MIIIVINDVVVVLFVALVVSVCRLRYWKLFL